MPSRWTPERFERFCARHHIERKHLLLIGLFLQCGHRETRFVSALLAFARGEGPAAIAAGRKECVAA